MNRWRVTALMVALAVGSVLIATTSAVGSPPEATGKPILDQFNPGTLSSTINGGSAAYEWQQGITAGIAGQLTRIDLFVAIDAALGEVSATEVSLRLGSPWEIGTPAWTTTAVLSSGWNTFDLAKAKILVDVGDEYVIGIHGQSEFNFNPGIGISYDEQYPGGDLFVNGSSAESEGNDLLFRTYVRPKRVKGNYQQSFVRDLDEVPLYDSRKSVDDELLALATQVEEAHGADEVSRALERGYAAVVQQHRTQGAVRDSSQALQDLEALMRAH